MCQCPPHTQPKNLFDNIFNPSGADGAYTFDVAGDNLIEKYENIQKIKANKVLMFSGAEDPVSDYGKAIKKLCKLYNKNGVDCSCIIIPNARHESFNEISEVKQQVFSLVKNFFL